MRAMSVVFSLAVLLLLGLGAAFPARAQVTCSLSGPEELCPEEAFDVCMTVCNEGSEPIYVRVFAPEGYEICCNLEVPAYGCASCTDHRGICYCGGDFTLNYSVHDEVCDVLTS